MSYRGVGSYYEIPQPMNGMGSYYSFSPHEVYSGYGGFGASDIDFSADKVMADIAISDVCYGPGGTGQPSGACNAAGQRVNKAVSAALNELGYGPLAVDGSINWKTAWKKFLADFQMTPGPGFGLSRQGLQLMEQQLAKGETPGPAAPVVYEKVDGEYLPKGKPSDQIAAASMAAGGTLLLAVAAVGVLGYLAYTSGKKKKGAPPARVTMT